MVKNNWYVITGGPSTGKTTLLSELEKLGHKTLPEAARLVIDEGVSRGLTVQQIRADEEAFQREVLRLKQKVESELEPDVLTFLDRGMHDSIAYLRHYGFALEKWMEQLFNEASYRQVFLLDPLPKFVADYARTEDHAFPKRLHKLLHDAYAEFNMEPIHVPPLGPKKRAQFVLKHVEEMEGSSRGQQVVIS